MPVAKATVWRSRSTLRGRLYPSSGPLAAESRRKVEPKSPPPHPQASAEVEAVGGFDGVLSALTFFCDFQTSVERHSCESPFNVLVADHHDARYPEPLLDDPH